MNNTTQEKQVCLVGTNKHNKLRVKIVGPDFDPKLGTREALEVYQQENKELLTANWTNIKILNYPYRERND